MNDSDTIRVPKARLREVKAEIDSLTAERETLRKELASLREEHENLRAHLTGSIREIAKLKEQLDDGQEAAVAEEPEEETTEDATE